MANDISLKREAVSKAYHSEAWQKKVAKMPDAQVIAVYLRLKAQNKL